LIGAESFDFFAVLVIDIVPVLSDLNMTYALPPKSEYREQHYCYENDIFHKTVRKDKYKNLITSHYIVTFRIFYISLLHFCEIQHPVRNIL